MYLQLIQLQRKTLKSIKWTLVYLIKFIHNHRAHNLKSVPWLNEMYICVHEIVKMCLTSLNIVYHHLTGNVYACLSACYLLWKVELFMKTSIFFMMTYGLSPFICLCSVLQLIEHNNSAINFISCCQKNARLSRSKCNLLHNYCYHECLLRSGL